MNQFCFRNCILYHPAAYNTSNSCGRSANKDLANTRGPPFRIMNYSFRYVEGHFFASLLCC